MYLVLSIVLIQGITGLRPAGNNPDSPDHSRMISTCHVDSVSHEIV